MNTENLYLTIMDNLRDGVYYVDKERKVIFWNNAAESITGYTAAELIGKTCPDSLLKHLDENGCPLSMGGCPLYDTITDGTPRGMRSFIRHKDGYRIPVLANMIPIFDNAEIVGAVEIFTQDSPTIYEDNLVERLSGIAMHDALTKLPNRRYLDSVLNYKLNDAKRFGRDLAVLFADIDDFSKFNNTYGHEVGDEILTTVAERILQNKRKDDFVGRWGGEEILGIYSIVRPEDTLTVGEKFRKLVSNTEIYYDALTLNVSVSVGITLARKDDTAATIIKRADTLMYKSKTSGKNCVTTD